MKLTIRGSYIEKFLDHLMNHQFLKQEFTLWI